MTSSSLYGVIEPSSFPRQHTEAVPMGEQLAQCCQAPAPHSPCPLCPPLELGARRSCWRAGGHPSGTVQSGSSAPAALLCSHPGTAASSRASYVDGAVRSALQCRARPRVALHQHERLLQSCGSAPGMALRNTRQRGSGNSRFIPALVQSCPPCSTACSNSGTAAPAAALCCVALLLCAELYLYAGTRAV